MKTLIKAALVLGVTSFVWVNSSAQDSKTVQEVCVGSGVHCATLDYGSIRMTFVKSPKAPGIRIKEETSKEG